MLILNPLQHYNHKTRARHQFVLFGNTNLYFDLVEGFRLILIEQLLMKLLVYASIWCIRVSKCGI